MTELAESLRKAVDLHRVGKLDEASRYYGEILRIDPNHVEARHNLGHLYLSQSRNADAIVCFEQVIDQHPDLAGVRSHLAKAHHQSGQLAAAAENYRAAIAIDPNVAEFHNELGIVLGQLGQTEEAAVCFERAVALSPRNAEALCNLGTIRYGRGQLDEAADCFERAIDINPRFAVAHLNLGTVHKYRDRYHQAIDCFDRALELASDLSPAHLNRGVALKDLGRVDEALVAYNNGLRLKPGDPELLLHRGLCRLIVGDYEAGWIDYEARWDDQIPRRGFPQPLWNGASLADRTILVYAEQGLGDEVMFASCLPDVIEQSRACLIEVDPRLVRLFDRSFPSAKVVPRPADRSLDDGEQIDCQIAMGSLPRYLRTSEADFPRQTRHLIADSNRVDFWRARWGELGNGLKVGIAWQGGNHPELRRRRSTALADWDEVLKISGVQFVSLQYGECADDIAECEQQCGVRIHQPDDGKPGADLDEFSAQVAALDLVITIDNSTAHLAGALGVPVWNLLPFAGNWRWLLHRGDTPWYRSMRLFRQPEPGDWSDVFNRVATELLRLRTVSPAARLRKADRRQPRIAQAESAPRIPPAPGTVLAAELSGGCQADPSVDQTVPSQRVSDRPDTSALNPPPPTLHPQPSPLDEALSDRERKKYEEIWQHNVYREYSPGLHDADKVQLIDHLRQFGVRAILDAGCGSGKLMQKLLTEHRDEFDVHGFDISANCLDSFFDDLRDEILTVGCLWNRDDFPGQYDAVICTDVMEHIPTEHVPAVLSNLRHSTKKLCYLAVALFADGFGPQLVGEPLHLTVKPPNWWFAQIGIAGFQIHSQAVERTPAGEDLWLHVFATV